VGGNVSELKVGDLIEFDASVDKRTNKPVALNIIKYDQQQTLSKPNEKTFLSALSHQAQRQQNTERLSEPILGNVVSVSRIKQNLSVRKNKISIFLTRLQFQIEVLIDLENVF
jgi:hypothetical protein